MNYNCECGNEIPSHIDGKEVLYCSKCGKKLNMTCPRCATEFKPFDGANNECPKCQQRFVSCNNCASFYPVGTAKCAEPGCCGASLLANYNYYTPCFVNKNRSNAYDAANFALRPNIHGIEIGSPISDCIVYCNDIYFWKEVGAGSSLMQLSYDGTRQNAIAQINGQPKDIGFFDLQGIYLITCVRRQASVHSIIDGALKFTADIGADRYRILLEGDDVYIQTDNGSQQKIVKYADFSDDPHEILTSPLNRGENQSLPAPPVCCEGNLYFANFDKGILVYNPNNESKTQIITSSFVYQMVPIPDKRQLLAVHLRQVGLLNIASGKYSECDALLNVGSISYFESVTYAGAKKNEHFFGELRPEFGELADMQKNKPYRSYNDRLVRFFTIHSEKRELVIIEREKGAGNFKELSFFDLSKTNTISIDEFRFNCSIFAMGGTLVYADKDKGVFFTKELI